MPLKLSKVQSLMEELEDARFTYGLGKKINPLGKQFSPGQGGEVDCSGCVEWVVFHGCGGLPEHFPDGSAQQHEWCDRVGLKKSANADGGLKDGFIRIGFLTPSDGGGTGHVILVANGKTYESHGGRGPDSRPWDPIRYPFMAKMHLYVFALPEAA